MPHLDNLSLRPALRYYFRHGWRLYITGTLVAIIILSVIGLSVWPVAAAAVVKYFIAVPSQKELLLQWSTQNEYDLSGFEVLCKQESQLDNDYHVIGTVAAQGGPQQGANYVFPVLYTALQPGLNYCFRLRDINIDGKSEDIFDRCGYGINITPTPAGTFTNTLGLDATAVLRNARATATALFFDANATAVALGANGTIIVTPTPITATNPLTATNGLTTTNPLSPNLNLTATVPVTGAINATSTPVVINPQDAPAATATALAISATLQATNSGQITATPTETPISNSPLPGPVTPTTQTQSSGINSTVDAANINNTATAQAIAQAPPVEQTPADPAHPSDQQNGDVGSANGGQQPANSLPSPLYIAVTETPTAITTPVAPTLTPFPNITPPQNPQRLVDYLTTPAMQNLTLTLLCLTFVSASGLGILGLITSALYMRSRRGVVDMPRRRK